MTAPARKIRVLVVDDSASVRSILTRNLDRDPFIEVVGTARDGIEAIEQLQALEPDVITLDVEMPRMGGLQTIERIMATRPTPIVMVSSLTKEGAATTVQALELGAIDFVAKPVHIGVPAVHEVSEEIRAKVRAAVGARVRAGAAHPVRRQAPGHARPPTAAGPPASRSRKVLVIGSSTGGPPALREVLTVLPGDIGVPILVVQHMPPGFTKALAERLDSLCEISVEEAQPGSRLEPNRALLAPGGFHMVVTPDGGVRLTMSPPECGVRPSLNVTMESLVPAYGPEVIAAVLTGMGSDGTRGAGLIKAAGGTVIVQDEATCAVYGMPRSIVQAGLADGVLPLHRMGAELARLCERRAFAEVGP